MNAHQYKKTVPFSHFVCVADECQEGTGQDHRVAGGSGTDEAAPARRGLGAQTLVPQSAGLQAGPTTPAQTGQRCTQGQTL